MQDKATKTALEKSIIHWEEVIIEDNPNAIELGHNACALCEMFWHEDCEGCPVKENTGMIFCRNTPHEDARLAVDLWEAEPTEQGKKAFRKAAVVELDFLKSLRETEDAN